MYQMMLMHHGSVATYRKVVNICKANGRGGDLSAVLEGLANGTLSIENIAVQTFLDIGRMIKVENLKQIRYERLTLNFWTTVYKMFRGRAIHLFRSIIACDTDGIDTGAVRKLNILTLGKMTNMAHFHGGHLIFIMLP